MNNALVLTVVEGFHLPESRTQGDKTYWSQKLYAQVGKPFPIEIKVSIPDMSKALVPGEYQVQPTAFQAGKYGDLEVNRFDLYQHLSVYKKPVSATVQK